MPKSEIHPLSYLTGDFPDTLFLNPIDDIEVSILINNLKECTPGEDNIPAKIIKKGHDILTPPMVHLINLSFSQGYFPD